MTTRWLALGEPGCAHLELLGAATSLTVPRARDGAGAGRAPNTGTQEHPARKCFWLLDLVLWARPLDADGYPYAIQVSQTKAVAEG